jgi:hypothetical protein
MRRLLRTPVARRGALIPILATTLAFIGTWLAAPAALAETITSPNGMVTCPFRHP